MDAKAQPPETVISVAIDAASRSTCLKSQRGAALYEVRDGNVVRASAAGSNGPPRGFPCTGSPACRAHCRMICEHAEARAIRQAMIGDRFECLRPLSDLVHVKVVHGPLADGKLVAGGGPSCVQCSRLIVDVGFIAGVWLHEATPEEWCPHVDLPRTECTFCQGVDCIANGGKCEASDSGPCPHDVLERHGEMPTVDARWRRYTAADFHRVTLRNLGIEV